MQKENQVTEIKVVGSPTAALEKLRVGWSLKAPNIQRVSFNGTTVRMRNYSTKRFTFKKVNDEYFTIKRIK